MYIYNPNRKDIDRTGYLQVKESKVTIHVYAVTIGNYIVMVGNMQHT